MSEPSEQNVSATVFTQRPASLVFTQRVIWLMFKGVMEADSSPICTMASKVVDW